MFNQNNYAQSKYNSTKPTQKAPGRKKVFRRIRPTEVRLVTLKLKIIGAKRFEVTLDIQIVGKKLFEKKLKLKILGKILAKRKLPITINGSVKKKIDLLRKLIGAKQFDTFKSIKTSGRSLKNRYKEYKLFGGTLNKVTFEATIYTLKKLAFYKKVQIVSGVRSDVRINKTLQGKKILNTHYEEIINGERDVRKIYLALMNIE